MKLVLKRTRVPACHKGSNPCPTPPRAPVSACDTITLRGDGRSRREAGTNKGFRSARRGPRRRSSRRSPAAWGGGGRGGRSGRRRPRRRRLLWRFVGLVLRGGRPGRSRCRLSRRAFVARRGRVDGRATSMVAGLRRDFSQRSARVLQRPKLAHTKAGAPSCEPWGSFAFFDAVCV